MFLTWLLGLQFSPFLFFFFHCLTFFFLPLTTYFYWSARISACVESNLFVSLFLVWPVHSPGTLLERAAYLRSYPVSKSCDSNATEGRIEIHSCQLRPWTCHSGRSLLKTGILKNRRWCFFQFLHEWNLIRPPYVIVHLPQGLACCVFWNGFLCVTVLYQVL